MVLLSKFAQTIGFLTALESHGIAADAIAV